MVKQGEATRTNKKNKWADARLGTAGVERKQRGEMEDTKEARGKGERKKIKEWDEPDAFNRSLSYAVV